MLGQARHLLQFHENPAVVAWWCTRLGRPLDWLTPARRRAILAVAAGLAGILYPLTTLRGGKDWQQALDGLAISLVVLVLFGFLWLVYRAAAAFAALPAPVRGHPQLSLHLVYWACLGILWATPADAGLWRTVLFGVAVMFPFLLWRCGYLIFSGQYGRIRGTGFSDHLITLWPAFGGNNTPYGKGLDYLARCEAKTAEQLARAQLSGIRLIGLGIIWGVTLFVLEGILYGDGNALTRFLGGPRLPVPGLDEVVVQGAGAPVAAAWAGIYCELFKQVLRHAAGSHAIIGVLRLFGFNVFRSTYKPLLAESISEFWNRYYYYFKELLANFFFLPTFARLGRRLRNWPRLRLLCAVFAAALVGNLYYHLLRMAVPLAEGRILPSLAALDSRMLYCLLLAIGIYVSMLREQGRLGQGARPGGVRRVLRIFGVWTFFGLIFIWDVRSPASLLTRVDFFLGLFGIG